jgi:hypothetical protein
MWIPPYLAQTVCFLCAQESGRTFYGGTAFWVMKKEDDCPDLGWGYLVTAKHCVEKAFERYGNLSCRINKRDGGVKFIPLPSLSGWHISDDADVAVLPFEVPEKETDLMSIPPDTFLTDEMIQKEAIGLGDEVFLIGLFHLVHGREKNYPIIRSGIVAAMPDEAFQDEATGLDYRAFLIEVRSIGGLSGSPVFLALKKRGVEMHPPPRGFNSWTHSLVLMGLIRSHWDLFAKDDHADFAVEGMEKLNTGIAVVTPMQEVEKVLMNDELRKGRRADVKKYQKARHL